MEDYSVPFDCNEFWDKKDVVLVRRKYRVTRWKDFILEHRWFVQKITKFKLNKNGKTIEI